MLISIALLSLVFVMVVGAAAPVRAEIPLFPVEQEIIDQTNAERKKYGLAPLVIDQKLVQWSRDQAWWMTTQRNLQHTGRPVGENIAMGQRSTAQAVRDWMNSSGHRANILNRNYKKMGAAAYITPGGTIYWCQQFLH